MSIAPIIKTLEVKAPPARAFELFTSQMGQWWPAGKTPGKAPHVAIVMEPRTDGRWFERDAEGRETQWGKVLTWDPPQRVLLAWQLNSAWTYDANLATEVELTFVPGANGGSVVTLEHRHLERFGNDAKKMAELLGGGWTPRLDEYVRFANADAKA